MEIYPSAQSSLQKLNFDNSSQKTLKIRYKTFAVRSNFTGYLYLVQNILPQIVWANNFLVFTCPSLLQTCILGHIMYNFKLFLKSKKIYINKSVALKFQIQWFCVSTILYIWFRSKFDFRKLSHLMMGSFLKKLFFLSQNGQFFQIFESSLEVQRVKEKFSNNPGHNILELFNNLVQVQIATSKTKLGL